MTGFFISCEGIDGTGKSVQIKRLVENLKAAGHDVFLTKEPGDQNCGSNVGAGVRNLLFKDPTTLKMHPGVADLLFLADHIQTAGDIAEQVAQGRVVVSDRYADSQWAYNASEGKHCPQWVMDLFGSHYGIVPDMTVLLVARGVVPVDVFRKPLQHGYETPEDISWALSRGKARQGEEAGKQAGKAWNNAEDQRRIQNEYLRILKGQRRTFTVDVWEATTVTSIADTIAWEVLRRIDALTVSQAQEKAA